ncbi:hypothetical protein E4U55_005164, partial [Claviceps digitariae]
MSRKSVHVVIHRDDMTVTIAGIYTTLYAANVECLRLCGEGNVAAEEPRSGVSWYSPEGIA